MVDQVDGGIVGLGVGRGVGGGFGVGDGPLPDGRTSIAEI